MAEPGKLDLVERLTNECIDLCRSIVRGRRALDPLLDHAFRADKLQRALNEQKTAISEMETAVDRIMSAVEKIAEIDFSDRERAEHQASACCDAIMEACCFQDISGQRLTYVIETLGEVARGLDSAAEGRQATASSPVTDGLLNGPGLPGNATEQDAVDRLLAGGSK